MTERLECSWRAWKWSHINSENHFFILQYVITKLRVFDTFLLTNSIYCSLMNIFSFWFLRGIQINWQYENRLIIILLFSNSDCPLLKYFQIHRNAKIGQDGLMEIWSMHSLTHSFPIHPFSTLWKHQKTVRFSGFSSGQRKIVLGTNGLKIIFSLVKKDPVIQYCLHISRKSHLYSSQSFVVLPSIAKWDCPGIASR